MSKRFSQRQGFLPANQPITVRDDAPRNLRYAIAQIAYEAGASADGLRGLITRALRVAPNPDNWSRSNVEQEVYDLLADVPWYRVYDIAEAIYEGFNYRLGGDPDTFQTELNRYFDENGIGWQMVSGQIQMRGEAEFETTVGRALEALSSGTHSAAERELKEARADLSRRPSPDLTGAVHHAMAALEAVAREVGHDEKATLGDLIPRLGGIPKPLDTALSKIWGYASEAARHVREGTTPGQEEAELVVGVSASVIAYLLQKAGS